MGRTMMKWDAAAHEDMLICIVRHCELNSGNMGKVLADMQKKGYEFTENAFRYELPCPWSSSCLVFHPRSGCFLLFSPSLLLLFFPLSVRVFGVQISHLPIKLP